MISPPFRALHIGDLHFWRIPLNPFAYFNKRLLGVGNLVIGGRSRKFRQKLAPTLVERLIELKPHTLLFSGDFTSTSAPSEFVAARDAFETAIAAATFGAHSVPGNHDCYLGKKLDVVHFHDRLGDSFRPVKHLEFSLLNDEIPLFQMNATTKNGLGSHGRVQPEHIELMTHIFAEQKHQAKALWFLCHFPAEDPAGVLKHDRGPQLRECEPLLEFFKSLPIPVFFLHGHHHYRWIYGSPTVPNLTYLNGGAPLLMRNKRKPDLGFHELLYEDGKTSVISHRLSPDTAVWSHREVRIPQPGELIDLQG